MNVCDGMSVEVHHKFVWNEKRNNKEFVGFKLNKQHRKVNVVSCTVEHKTKTEGRYLRTLIFGSDWFNQEHNNEGGEKLTRWYGSSRKNQ